MLSYLFYIKLSLTNLANYASIFVIRIILRKWEAFVNAVSTPGQCTELALLCLPVELLDAEKALRLVL